MQYAIIKTVDQVVRIVKNGTPRLCTFRLYANGVVEVNLVGRLPIRITKGTHGLWTVDWCGRYGEKPDTPRCILAETARSAYELAVEVFWGIAPWEFQVGQTVSYLAVGKIARMEGKEGHVVLCTILKVDEEREELTLAPIHRQKPTARFNGRSEIVAFEEIIARS